MAPLLVIANGNASHAREGLADDVAAMLRAAGASAECVTTASEEEFAEVWPRDPERRVVLVGGDGTLHAAVNMPGPLPEIALIASGQANNVASSLGIPTGHRAAARLAANGRVRGVDLIAAASPSRACRVVEGVSVGFLARAREHYHARDSAHPALAIEAGLVALASHRPFPLRLELDGQPERCRVSQVFVANLPRYGPRLRVAPGADPSDGLLDVVTLGPRGRAGVVTMLRDLRRGRLRPWLDRVRRASRVRIDVGGASVAFADSENLGTGPIELSAEPSALRIVVPSSAPSRR